MELLISNSRLWLGMGPSLSGGEERAKGKGQGAKGKGQRARGKGQRARSIGQRAKGTERFTLRFALCPLRFVAALQMLVQEFRLGVDINEFKVLIEITDQMP